MTTAPQITLNDGHSIPQVGLGVYKVTDAEAVDAIGVALENGYRHIDTATLYENEVGVGEALRRADVPRAEIFVTTKVFQDRHGYDEARRSFDESLERLQLDYVDLFLIHWPAPRQNLYVETWRALEKIQADGLARSIGVSNFHTHHLDRLAAEASVVPSVNQVELHPWLPQAELRAYDDAHGIVTEAWSPLARGRVLENVVLDRLAAKYGTTPAQIVIRWHVQLGNVVIPKSVTPSRIASNIDVFGFELDADDLALISKLESGERTGRDPDDVG
ncbi:aldo/keto reductase [Subtercola boreus]|uniref:Oxidoreductase n=1 Tax=Subtercola boreus TaxID=120213 RepID=A0A3E0WAS5_9MICO|nr:aldo/keto reductase [Subtercola boreus]RFA19878.1 oxidoreductase [Subtercola boreus]RFA19945.1 oxidoreductase [Subtercola boreus]RFA26338.1 oxidoreductase [Subtercola boreus]